MTRRLLGLLIGVVLAGGCASQPVVTTSPAIALATPSPAPTVPPTATPSRSPSPGESIPPGAVPSSGPATGTATLSGTDNQTGPPFTLSGGDYVVTWSATSTVDANSASRFEVRGVLDEDEYATWSVTAEIPGGLPRTGAEEIYGLPGGEYHFTIITTDTTWQVSIAPR